MKVDYHIHSSFSGDSNTPIEDMIQRGIELGLTTMCFTEHMDLDYDCPGMDFNLDTPSYYRSLKKLKETYQDQIELLFGVELGLQPHLAPILNAYVESYPFDFVIGSSHVVHGKDPYYPAFFENRSEKECYLEYFESILENINSFSNCDVYGHIDYVVRYGPNKAQNYSYSAYKEILDEILIALIRNQIGLELNTAGFKYGLDFPNPHPDILKRYQKLGGKIVTIGSDAHQPQHLAYEFQRVRKLLLECGFTSYTEFHKRTPSFHSL